MAYLDFKNISQDDYSILNKRINKLIFIKGVAIFKDSTATKRRIILGDKKLQENDLSIITNENKFLFDNCFMYVERFYNEILINDYGLFQIKRKSIDYNGKEQFTTSIWDFEANHLSEHEFGKLILILSNRNKCFSPKEFIRCVPELEKSSFKVVNRKSGIWKKKEGETYFEFDKETKCGLTFNSIERTRTGSDSSIESEYIKDKNGNTLMLNDFYKGMMMLQNGYEYISELRNLFINAEINKFE